MLEIQILKRRWRQTGKNNLKKNSLSLYLVFIRGSTHSIHLLLWDRFIRLLVWSVAENCLEYVNRWRERSQKAKAIDYYDCARALWSVSYGLFCIMPPASRRRFCTFSFRRLFLFLWTKWAEPNRTEQQLRSGIGSQTPPPKHGPNQNAIERKDEVEERRERRRENKRCQREGSRTRRWLPVEKASISDQVHARPSDALPMKPDVPKFLQFVV